MDIGKAILVSAVVVSSAVLIGTNQGGSAQGQDTRAEPRYQIVTANYAFAWRLNTVTGEVSACALKDRSQGHGEGCTRLKELISEADFDFSK